MYYLFRFATVVVPWIPDRLVHALGTVAGLIAWPIATKARRQATKNIRHVFGPQLQETRAGRKRLRRTVQAMFVNNVRNYLELFSLRSLSSDEILRNIHVEGIEHLDKGLAQAKGVILVSAHLGPFDYIIHYMSIKGYDVTIPVERLK